MLAFILSQPRSGSTVLSAMLDRRKGVVVMPESSFPQVLGAIRPDERDNRRLLAALYMGSTFPPLPRPPTPLSLEEAEECMRGDDTEILQTLGRAVAAKLGRLPSEVRHVIWKTTRTPGFLRTPLATGGKFVLLRRHPYNVYESQFRVDFGAANRNPFRYGIFLQSYENVFGRIPKERAIEITYDKIPQQLPPLLEFLSIADEGLWSGSGTIDLVAKSGAWLADATKEFRNTDPEKRARLDRKKIAVLDAALALTSVLRPFLAPVRDYYDRRSLNHIRHVAGMHLRGEIPPP